MCQKLSVVVLYDRAVAEASTCCPFGDSELSRRFLLKFNYACVFTFLFPYFVTCLNNEPGTHRTYHACRCVAAKKLSTGLKLVGQSVFRRATKIHPQCCSTKSQCFARARACACARRFDDRHLAPAYVCQCSATNSARTCSISKLQQRQQFVSLKQYYFKQAVQAFCPETQVCLIQVDRATAICRRHKCSAVDDS